MFRSMEERDHPSHSCLILWGNITMNVNFVWYKRYRKHKTCVKSLKMEAAIHSSHSTHIKAIFFIRFPLKLIHICKPQTIIFSFENNFSCWFYLHSKTSGDAFLQTFIKLSLFSQKAYCTPKHFLCIQKSRWFDLKYMFIFKFFEIWVIAL